MPTGHVYTLVHPRANFDRQMAQTPLIFLYALTNTLSKLHEYRPNICGSKLYFYCTIITVCIYTLL